MGLLAILGLVLLLTKSSLETPSKYYENDFVYPRIHKREVVSSKQKNKYLNGVANEFIEEKLIEHGQALEHLVTMVQKNEELTRKLVEKLSNSRKSDTPELPEKLEFQQSGRRSLGQVDVSPADRGEEGNPWCIVAYLCRETGNPVCGFDSDYGYGKFKDICHMYKVNCYWKYTFLISPTCDNVGYL